MAKNKKIPKIFSGPDIRHGISLFSPKELDAVENLVIEKDEKYFIIAY